jgi:hypothetical protein
MPENTLLDYEVFEALKAELGHGSVANAVSFSEAVLGYGFLAGEGNAHPVQFVLLCHSASEDPIRELIQRAFGEKQFSLLGTEIEVSVLSSVGPAELRHAISITKAVPDPVEPSDKDHDLNEWAQISLGQTLRQVVLNEHRKIVLPSYLLRYTPFTSPNLIILRAALSQIHYLHQSGNLSDEFEQRTVSAKMSEISRWSSFSRTSIYRLLYEDPRSRWLVDVENKGSYQNNQGQHISQPNQYLLQPIQLTPGDATDLLKYLETHKDEWQGVDDCLIALAKIEPRKILAYPYRLPQEGDFSQPMPILSIVQQCFGLFEMNAERLALIDKVRENLIGRDFITIPWYLLRNLLPVYGASIITLYMMCQPLLFRQGGVQRDTFWLPGGDETLIAWTGDRSLSKYFPKANAKGRGRPAGEEGSSDSAWRKGKRELLSDFFLRVETRKDRHGLTQWKVQIHDHPILPNDEQLIANLYQIIADLNQQGKLTILLTLFEQSIFTDSRDGRLMIDRLYRTTLNQGESQALSLIANRLFSDFVTPEDPIISDFETPVSRLISIFEPPVQQIISEKATPAAVLFSVFETYLKILYMIKDSIKQIKDTNHHPDSLNSGDLDEQKRSEDWNFPEILRSVNQELREKVLQDSSKRESFIAWLIQSCLNSRIQQPLNLALSKTVQNDAKPDSAALRLAGQSPTTLLSVLVMVQSDPNRINFQKDSDTRAIAADIQQLLMGEDGQKQPVLIQRLIDGLAF